MEQGSRSQSTLHHIFATISPRMETSLLLIVGIYLGPHFKMHGDEHKNFEVTEKCGNFKTDIQYV